MNDYEQDMQDMAEVEALRDAVFQNFLASVKSENKSAREFVAEYGFTGVLSGLQNHGIKDKLDLYRKLSLALGED